MPCYHPLQAFQCLDGSVVFYERRRFDTVKTLWLPCGQCIGCRLERSRQWAMRCMHEAALHERNCFVTLTYDDAHLPAHGALEYPAFQGFMKRLRKLASPQRVRFYMCGEYGPLSWRPHFHACLFGWDFDDKTYWRTTPAGSKCYRSAVLERLWPAGNCELGRITFESAAYVARYCVQKITGPGAAAHYTRQGADGCHRLPPEFNSMSLKPGIGAAWLEKFRSDVYPHDYVVVNAKETKPPKFYDQVVKRTDPDLYEELKFKREQSGRERFEDNTPERLAVKEIVTKARAAFLKRGTDPCLS